MLFVIPPSKERTFLMAGVTSLVQMFKPPWPGTWFSSRRSTVSHQLRFELWYLNAKPVPRFVVEDVLFACSACVR